MFWKFLKFWEQNVVIGWHVGDGIFGSVVEISLIIGAGLLVLKWFLKKNNWGEKWKEWEDHVMRGAFLLFAASFLIATFLIAPFLQSGNEPHPKIGETLPVPPQKPPKALPTIITPATPPPTPTGQTAQSQDQLESFNPEDGGTNSFTFRREQQSAQQAAGELIKRTNSLVWWNKLLPFCRYTLTALNDELVLWAAGHGDGLSAPSNYGQCLSTNIDDTIAEFEPTHIGLQENTNMNFIITISSPDGANHRYLTINSSKSSLEMDDQWGDTVRCHVHVYEGNPEFDDDNIVPNTNADKMIAASIKEMVEGQYWALTNK